MLVGLSFGRSEVVKKGVFVLDNEYGDISFIRKNYLFQVWVMGIEDGEEKVKQLVKTLEVNVRVKIFSVLVND